MFTGIIEALGTVTKLTPEGSNLHIAIKSKLAKELKVDQSISHNGVCLTVVKQDNQFYTVTAIEETLKKSNLSNLIVGDLVNLERAMKLGDRLDGHIVQGHVDQIGTCTGIGEADGSWVYSFSYDSSIGNLTIEKGSITVNGVSLTVVDSEENSFKVAIIPYTYEHTNFNFFRKETVVNLEFDVVGKYLRRLNESYS